MSWENIRQATKNIIGQNLYYWCLVLIAVSMPLSPFLLSASQLLMAINWLLSGNYEHKIQLFKQNKLIAILLILPLIHILWLTNTSDFAYALHDIKIKLPLIALPLIIGTTDALTYKQLRSILLFFTAAVLASSLISLAVYTGILPRQINDIRKISIFISHIRFGLMVLFAFIIVIYYLFKHYNQIKPILKIVSILILIWFLVFLIILQSFTSWAIILVLIISLYFIYYPRLTNKTIKTTITALLFITVISSTILTINIYKRISAQNDPPFSQLPQYTAQGNKYEHDTLSIAKENGHYIWIYLATGELEKTWEQVSKISYSGYDNKGQLIKFTLIRYLASKGLTRDREGVLALTPQDIEMIENGHASVVYLKKFKPYVRLYEILWELDYYMRLNDPNSKSVSMRIEFIKTSMYIIKNNFFAGVGTGDVKNAFDNAYRELDSPLKLNYRLRAHNQYITFFISFGLFGFILCMFAIIAPIIIVRKKGNILIFTFIIMLLSSMMSEDTLETQAGVTFFISFYTLLLFATKHNNI